MSSGLSPSGLSPSGLSPSGLGSTTGQPSTIGLRTEGAPTAPGHQGDGASQPELYLHVKSGKPTAIFSRSSTGDSGETSNGLGLFEHAASGPSALAEGVHRVQVGGSFVYVSKRSVGRVAPQSDAAKVVADVTARPVAPVSRRRPVEMGTDPTAIAQLAGEAQPLAAAATTKA